MKVLLFVQTGDARPKCVHPNVPERMSRRSGEAIRDVFRDPARLGLVRLAAVHGEWAAEVAAADRWWLVECENAEHGRRVIESDGRLCRCSSCGAEGDGDSQAFEFCAEDTIAEWGRILAQGGRP